MACGALEGTMPSRKVYPVAAVAVFVCKESHVFSCRAGVAHSMAISAMASATKKDPGCNYGSRLH